ncbi:hypothetical protein STVIR_4277 [Streptomyces viridochromogenes Tue57]|uniref:Uncharacterized protein n=1 Tax=Streptomyces viridochromogenes Tue57 TaxID=1160705 RepID=L8PEJ7_STRVR|nr:hypothetical protein STVIR_4277 [Streptomyces viridochromogenes Tue57]
MAAVEAGGFAHGVHLNDVRGPAPGQGERALVRAMWIVRE